jgi:DNA mismatch endonuclease (patch repair protein)
VFINGCFWHRHKNCKRASTPKSNKEYWVNKFLYNQNKDIIVNRKLKKMGYKVIIVWECQAKNINYLKRLSRKIEA